MKNLKIAVVVAATGSQGSAVVKALQQNGEYHVRAITRHPDGQAATALRSQGIEIVQADLANENSLVEAFAGSHLVFAVTDYAELVGTYGVEKGIEIEGQFGLNIVRAVESTPTVEHFIWSTLPRSGAISNGKITVPHYESKGRVDDYVQENPALLAKTTFLWVGWYDSNFNSPLAAPMPLSGTDKFFVIGDWPAKTPLAMIGDVKNNLTPFVTAILAHPEKTMAGTIVFASTGMVLFDEWLSSWERVHDKRLAYVRTDSATYLSLWPEFAHVVSKNLEYLSSVPFEVAWSDANRKVLRASDLGIGHESFVAAEKSLQNYKY